MGWVLAQCHHAIVATGTIPHDIVVIKISRGPAASDMAVIAVVRTRNMIDALTCGDRSVMTAPAGSQHM